MIPAKIARDHEAGLKPRKGRESIGMASGSGENAQHDKVKGFQEYAVKRCRPRNIPPIFADTVACIFHGICERVVRQRKHVYPL